MIKELAKFTTRLWLKNDSITSGLRKNISMPKLIKLKNRILL